MECIDASANLWGGSGGFLQGGPAARVHPSTDRLDVIAP
jgi:hypothetical protein